MFVSATSTERSLDDLADEITTLSAHINAAMCRWLELVAEFDRRCGWSDWGCKSCAHWIAWRCSMSGTAARERVRVANSLEHLPATRAAFARGELSYSKVRAISRLEDVEHEDELLAVAQAATASQLDRMVAAYRGVAAVEAGHERAVDRRSVRWAYDDEGMFRMRVDLPAEEGAIVQAAVEYVLEELRRGALSPRDEPTERVVPAITLADAFVAVADRALAAGAAERTGGERYQVVLDVDEATLRGDEDGSVAMIRGGAAVPAEIARRIACDATLVCAHDGRTGRRTRTIPSAVRRALRRRDQGCQFPGCANRRYLHAHHIEHWVNGGTHRLTNLVHLCTHHHPFVHEGGWTVDRDTHGALRFYRPDGRLLEPMPRSQRGHRRVVCTEPGIGPESIVPRWDGQPLNLGLAVDALLQVAPLEPRRPPLPRSD